MRKKVLAFIFVLVAVSCKHSYEVFSNKHMVSFSCDISKSPFNKVQTAGYFLGIRPTSTKDGYRVMEPNGKEQTIPYTEVHSRVFSFGLAGLIIGMPYFGEGEYYAYDLACPRCDNASSPLNINDEGLATCSKCSSIYDLNNSGIPKTSDSRPLYRYRTATNGNMLIVSN